MDDLVAYLSAHPVVLVVLAAIALVLIYFVIRKMVQFILVTMLLPD